MAQSLFEVNEDTGEISYSPGQDLVKEENVDAGGSVAPSDEVGDMVLSPENVPETLEEIEKEAPNVDLLDFGDSGVPVVLSEEVTAAILAASPAGGSIGSSTLDYFDRIVSGLPYDAVYIAYRNNSDDSYDAVLYFGQDYEISDHSVSFGKDALQIKVDRTSSSGYNNVTNYYSLDASYTTVDFEQSGDVVYYTNAVPGYPLLGGKVPPVGYDFYLVPALIGALAVVLLSKLVFRR